MYIKISKLFVVIIICISFSCSEFQKALKDDDIKKKYDLAEKYYESQDFRRASRLFEQIKPKYRGKPQGERISFFYANCLLNTKKYLLSAFEFESFVKAYPMSEKLTMKIDRQAALSELILECIVQIQQLQNPTALKDILEPYLPGNQRKAEDDR